MPEAAMPEARRSERLKSLLRARIVFNAGSSTIECVIKNVSAHGMRLEIAEASPRYCDVSHGFVWMFGLVGGFLA